MDSDEINDVRTLKDFRGKSFSGYKLSEVKVLLNKGVQLRNVGEGLYWLMELFCGGHINQVWDVLILIAVNNIGISNPKLCIYLNMKHEEFMEIYNNGYKGHELLLRNNSRCRSILCELMVILCMSPKQLVNEKLKIIDESDFIMENLYSKLKAKRDDYLDNILKEDDPLELFIGLNELAYSISDDNENKNLWCSMYWLDWIIEYEKYLKDNGNVLKCGYRKVKVSENFRKDTIWIVWDIIIERSGKDKLVEKIIRSLFKLFCANYKVGSKVKYKCILEMCIRLIIDYKKMNFSIPILDNKELMKKEEMLLNEIFIRLKENELSPKMDYLRKDMAERSEAEKRVDKLKKLNEIMK